MTAFLSPTRSTDSLARLTGDEQKAVKTTAFDLQMDPTAPGLSFHKLEGRKTSASGQYASAPTSG